MLAYETQQSYGGNHVAIKHYKDLQSMMEAKEEDEISLERSLAPISEGTPSFESVQFTGDLKSSQITLNFHYHKNSEVDQ